MLVQHTLPAIYDQHSRILILGSMPSPKSREVGFYYGHPQNRFWKVMAILFHTQLDSIEQRTLFLKKSGIALYDVLASCVIEKASDASIKQAIPNDLTPIFQTADIQAVFTTGKKAYELYQRYLSKQTGIEAILLPSTSPANAQKSLEDLVLAYAVIRPYLE